jgi:hypothetical protein
VIDGTQGSAIVFQRLMTSAPFQPERASENSRSSARHATGKGAPPTEWQLSALHDGTRVAAKVSLRTKLTLAHTAPRPFGARKGATFRSLANAWADTTLSIQVGRSSDLKSRRDFSLVAGMA